MRRLCSILAFLWCLSAPAAEVIPPSPAQYFNDYARVVSPGVAGQLNQTLENFERDSSEQIVVAVFPKMQSDSSIEDYTLRVFRAWKVGQKDKNNGAVLFVFVQDHKLFLQVGYGLEGALPDALCKRIIAEQLTPHFKNGDFAGGLQAGVSSLLAATKGEYKGTGSTAAERQGKSSPNFVITVAILFAVVAILFLLRGAKVSRGGSSWTIGSGGFSGGSWGGGGGFSGGGGGGGGGFSGGGGSCGGGGAGGSW